MLFPRPLPAFFAGFAVPAALLSAAAVAASSSALADTPRVIDAVSVTATRIERPVSEVPGNLTVIGRKEISESSAQTVDDLLRRIPGFSLFRRSSSMVANPTTQGVSLRGIGPSGVSRTLVLVDGIPHNDPFGGWVYWSSIPLESIERIEVLRGGGASVWGNYALAGVINIVTAGAARDRAVLAIDQGNRHTVRRELSVAKRSGATGYAADARWFDTGGYPIVRAEQRGPIDVAADSQHVTAGAQVEHVATSGVTLDGSVRFFHEERGNGTPITRNKTTSGFVRGGFRKAGRGGSEIRANVFARAQRYSSLFSGTDGRESEQPALDQFNVPSLSAGAQALWTRAPGERHLLTAGADVHWVDGETNENFRYVEGAFINRRRAGGSQALAGIFVQDLFAVTPSLQLSGAVRVDYWRSYEGERTRFDISGASPPSTERFDDRDEAVVSPKLGVVYDAGGGVSLRASAYRGFRAPTVNELYRPFRVRSDITAANADLEIEILTGAEAGVDLHGTKWTASATGFWNRVDDPIANVTLAEGPGSIDPCGFVPGDGLCRQRRNLADSRITGLEIEATTNPHASVVLRASYLWNDTEITGAAGFDEIEGNEIAQVPEHQAVAGAVIGDPRKLQIALQARYVGDQFEDDLNSRRLDDFVVVDAKLTRRLDDRWEVFIAAENLFDRRYDVGRTADGLVTEGTPLLVHGGLRYAFDER